MAAPPDRSDRTISIQLTLLATDPALLAGLSRLYELGLLSDERIRTLGREQLSCPLPITAAQPSAQGQIQADARAGLEPALAAASGGRFITSAQANLAAAAPVSQGKSVAPPRPPSVLGGWMQSFMAEVSVLWLLFLGLFMVVVSSAVLAASASDASVTKCRR